MLSFRSNLSFVLLYWISIQTGQVSADCTRTGLLAAANSYVAAQVSGNIESLNLTANFTYQENNKLAKISNSVLSRPLRVDLNHSMADTTACASYTMLISSSGSNPYVIGTQIRHNGNDTSSISMIDSITATTGALFFNASLTLIYIKQEDWGVLNGTLPSRELLKNIGDAYLDMWTNATAANSIPWGTECERVEGSQLTRPCGATLPHGGSTSINNMRRYVIDETTGSVDVLCEFASLGHMPDSHEIRVVDGKVKYVHTITVIQ